MSPSFWICSHLSFVLIVASMMCPLMKRLSRLQSMLLCLLIPMGVGLLPVRQTDVSGFVLAHTGTLSVSMLLLLMFQLSTGWRLVEPLSTQIWRNMNVVWISLGIIVYPSALGLLDVDTYEFGYQDAMSWCVLIASGIAVYCRYRILGLCLASAVLADLLRLFESPNLWDYLIDPWLCLAAVFALIAASCRCLLAAKPRKDFSANFASSGHAAHRPMPSAATASAET